MLRGLRFFASSAQRRGRPLDPACEFYNRIKSLIGIDSTEFEVHNAPKEGEPPQVMVISKQADYGKQIRGLKKQLATLEKSDDGIVGSIMTDSPSRGLLRHPVLVVGAYEKPKAVRKLDFSDSSDNNNCNM